MNTVAMAATGDARLSEIQFDQNYRITIWKNNVMQTHLATVFVGRPNDSHGAVIVVVSRLGGNGFELAIAG